MYRQVRRIPCYLLCSHTLVIEPDIQKYYSRAHRQHPLVFAVLCTFGLMGWLGIELNIVTALLSSISIGLGVDFTIHIFWRIKWELSNGNDYGRSISATLRTIGRGIIINASSVMLGFAVLFLSAFPLIREFAFLIIISLLLCLVSALVLIPALCYLLKPKFLESKKSKKD